MPVLNKHEVGLNVSVLIIKSRSASDGAVSWKRIVCGGCRECSALSRTVGVWVGARLQGRSVDRNWQRAGDRAFPGFGAWRWFLRVFSPSVFRSSAERNDSYGILVQEGPRASHLFRRRIRGFIWKLHWQWQAHGFYWGWVAQINKNSMVSYQSFYLYSHKIGGNVLLLISNTCLKHQGDFVG